MKVMRYLLVLAVMLSSAPLFPAPESVASAAQKEEQSRLTQIYNWLYARYGMSKQDWDIVKKWLIKKWHGQEIEPALDQQAKSIFKKYIIPILIIAALAGGGWWWRKKRIEQEARRSVEEEKKQVRWPKEFLELGIEENIKKGISLDSQLIMRAKEGKEDEIELLLEKGANINARDHLNGWTALMKAALWNRRDVILLLLKKGANINVQDFNGHTAYDFATPQTQKVIETFINNQMFNLILGERDPGSPIPPLPKEMHGRIYEYLQEKPLTKKQEKRLMERYKEGLWSRWFRWFGR